MIDPWFGSADPSWHSKGKLLEESDPGLGQPRSRRDAGTDHRDSGCRAASECRSVRRAGDTESENGVPCNARVSTYRADLLG